MYYSFTSKEKGEKMSTLEEIKAERDMYYNWYISSGEDGFPSDTDRDEGYPSKEYCLTQYKILNEWISVLERLET